MPDSDGLNPFFIRPVVRTEAGDAPQTGDGGLNPFFIRSVVRTPSYTPHDQRVVGLNPFFIRSVVRTQKMKHFAIYDVLIPSSSGQSFERKWWLSQIQPCSLNPFFIRSVVRTETASSMWPNLRGLNPFFIRSVVRTPEDAVAEAIARS